MLNNYPEISPWITSEDNEEDLNNRSKNYNQDLGKNIRLSNQNLQLFMEQNNTIKAHSFLLKSKSNIAISLEKKFI